MFQRITTIGRTKIGAGVAATILSAIGLAASVPADADPSVHELRTATPIQHVIIIVGENRSFDHLFATYVPKSGETVDNLFSKGIVTKDGQPGINLAGGVQYSAEDTTTYQVSPQSRSLY